MRQSSLFKAGQDAPPTKKVSDMIQTSYAPLFKRNGISPKTVNNPDKDYDENLLRHVLLLGN